MDHRIKVFLAGGITGCPDWQPEVIKALEDQDILVMNPRREGFDASNKDMEKQQIDWEYRHINYATCMLFWFPEETLCPITLFELGKTVNTRRHIVIGTHPGYKRRTDLLEQLFHHDPGIPIRDNLEDVLADLKEYVKRVW